ncbi:MAG: DUF4915 domain-containing protein [Planctomycetes bacterium]|nr:DUF4915 domain-containing protein [Planctomycetota bacterium]
MPQPSPQARGETPAQPVFELTASRGFAGWLAGQRSSLAFTTYQAGKVFFIGVQPDGRLSIFERTLERVMGLHASPSTLYLSTLCQVWRFENVLGPAQSFNGYDAVYTPRESRVTGELDVHDIAVDSGGRVVFLFLGGPAPPEPGPPGAGPPAAPCGADPDPPGSPGDLGCLGYEHCP